MAVSQFVDLIKRVAVDAVAGERPTQLIYGKVLSANPLSVQLDQQRILDAVFLKTLKYTGQVTTPDGTFEVEINPFQPGDVVAMIQKQGGQQFLIIGRAE